jgi:outer membrane protein TolC
MSRPSRALLRVLLPALAASGLAAQDALTIQDAIRKAWTGQSGLQAGAARVERAQAEAEALGRLRLPTVTLGAALTRTDEPMQVFGTRLDQARIGPQDFLPDRLDHPDPLTGGAAYLTVAQPLYAGGKLDAARRAGAALAEAETAAQAFRRQQVALAVDQAYFGAQVARQALAWAEDTLRQARETERFVRARVQEGLMLKSEGERARAFRAQSEAGVAEARERLAAARNALALLMGDEPPESLATPVAAGEADLPETPGRRGDLDALRAQGEAARQGIAAARGSLKPEVGLNLTAGTARYALADGGNWTAVAVGARWTFSFADRPRVHAARAAARAAELGLQWQTRQADRDAADARLALASARSRIASAQEALEASEGVRAMRLARHREGLLPLVEVLDAESGLSGARTLLLNSQLDGRLARARLALALGQPIEDVKE